MNFQLDPSNRLDFHAFFSPGALLKFIRNEDYWRIWKPLRRDAAVLELYHGSGAVARLRLDKEERIVEAELIEGERARTMVRQHIAPLPPNAERTSRRILGRGAPVDAAVHALGTALQRQLILFDRLQNGPDAQSLWRVAPEYSALEVTESPAGTIAQHRWRAHGDALDAYDRMRSVRNWEAPAYPGGRRNARTWAEAHLFLRTQRADLQETRVLDPWQHDLLAKTPEGPRIFAFHIADPHRTDPLDLGPGVSQVFNPVTFYLFAAQIQDQLPTDRSRVPAARQPLYAADLRLAAHVVEQALRFVPPTDTHAPLQTYDSEFHRKVAERRADQLSRTALSARHTYLLLLAKEWESAVG